MLTENGRLIAADKVEGTAVYNPKGEKLGSIENVMIDKITGKVAYADMSFGGFLGLGDKHHPLPWSILKYDSSKGGYVIDLDKEMLENAPNYDADENVDRAIRRGTASCTMIYGVPPYWI